MGGAPVLFALSNKRFEIFLRSSVKQYYAIHLKRKTGKQVSFGLVIIFI